jgi:cell division protein FtsI (penicillin-binding protein 3)
VPSRPPDPRRGSRGGVSDSSIDPTGTPLRGAADRGGQGRPGIGDARRYTPRGRSIREADVERGQRGRGGDPFRPALQVVQGGAGEPPRRGGRAAAARTRDGARAATATPTAAPSGSRRTTRTEPDAGRLPAPRTRAGSGRAGGSGRAAGGRPGGKAATPARGRQAGRAAPARRPARKPKRRVRLPDPRRRLRFATVIVLVLFLTITGRLVELQLIDAKGYAAKGLENRVQTIPLPAPRGTIYDRDRNVLVHSVEARYVYGDPGMVKDPESTARQLAPLIGRPASDLLPLLRPHKRADGTDSRFEFLAKGVEISRAEKVKALNLEGIGIKPDERRDRPGHDLASNLLGFTGWDGSGVTGLEAGYNSVLRGVPGERTFEIGGGDVAAEIPGGFTTGKPAKPGSSLQLTIDRDLQFRVQYLLSQQMQKVNAEFGSAVVLDVHNGEILAQASYPAYDAAEPMKSAPTQRLDANTDIVVDPGSVAKVIAIGGALQEGVIRPDSTIPVGPTIRKGDTTYSDTHPMPEGSRLTVPGILAYSSNVGTIKIADQLGAEKLYQYQRKFGLGVATGSGLPGEAAGLIQPPKNWSGSSYGSIPIGMGISATPLQMTAAYAAIANGGVWVQPHLVKSVITPDGKVDQAPAPHTNRVLSAPVADSLRQMLEAVVTVDGATGHRAAVPGYRVAGKTGTGKFVVNGKYGPGEVGSFVGMAPADAPRYVIGVFAYSPKGEGGDVSAPAFSDMMAFALGKNHVPPTGTNPPSFRAAG